MEPARRRSALKGGWRRAMASVVLLACSARHGGAFAPLQAPQANCRHHPRYHPVRGVCGLRMSVEDGSSRQDTNKTADWTQNLGAELLRAKRPKGVDDFVENIPQAPGSETRFRSSADEERVYPAYDSGATEDGGVGNRIGLEKTTGDFSGGLFADRRREPASGSDQVREVENNFVSAFSQEKNFIAGLIGIGVLAIFYISVFNGGGLEGARYGGGVPPGKGKVIERYEEAFVCYGIPTADDPGGCRDKRSVGPVRVFTRVADDAPPAAEGDEAGAPEE